MNENELKQYCLEHAGESLPAEAEALLQRDPHLKKQVDGLVLVQKLISLKRYEQPQPAALFRCQQAVRARIEQQNQSLWSGWRAWFTLEQPAFAYAVAAVAIGLVGVGVVLRGGSEEHAVLVQTEPALPLAVPEPVIMASESPTEFLASLPLAVTEDELPETVEFAAETTPVQEKPLIFLRSNSDPRNGRLSFGLPESTPVSYER